MTDQPTKEEKVKEKKPSEAKSSDSPTEAQQTKAGASAKEETKAAKVAVSPKLAKIIDEVSQLSVMELADLVKALEEKFGVSASPAIALAQAGAASGSAAASDAAPVEEKTEFDVHLTDSGANKIGVIKAVRELKPDLGLKEAKDLVDKGSAKLLESAKKEDAEEAKKKLEAAGAQVELK